MSVDILVYLSRSKMPNADKWTSTVQTSGHGVFLPADFDPIVHTGFLPCTYIGVDSGFEYYTGKLAPDDIQDMELGPDEQKLLEGCDYQVSFIVKGSRTLDYKTALVAAACLAKLSGGTTYDPQCSIFSTGETALAEADSIFIDMDKIEKNTITSPTPPPADKSPQDSWLNRIMGKLTGK